MATADATLPPPAPTTACRILARLARSRFAAAAADAVICSFLASLWLHFGAGVAAAIGSLACGSDDCRAADVAFQVMTFSLVFPVSVALLLLLVLVLSSMSSDTKLEEKKAPNQRSFAAAAWVMLRDPVVIGFLVSGAFILLMVAGALLKVYSPVKGSRKDRIASGMLDARLRTEVEEAHVCLPRDDVKKCLE
ncbi:hypothetical protein EJB05_49080 [Eragrostis curvula]|uniref:Uncharacterized protein n=1 Tax=Eragrostis curvula TaxID=38414 RepID=A0A5J9T3D7_9POAL|nr:hypothetical protein EJB05_49080 [Eragrostis curvula]